MKRLLTYLEIGNACNWGVTRSQYRGLPLAARQRMEAEVRAHIASLPDPAAPPGDTAMGRMDCWRGVRNDRTINTSRTLGCCGCRRGVPARPCPAMER